MKKTTTKTPASTKARGWRDLYILSDSTGNLAQHMLNAFLTQFPPGTFTLHGKVFLQTPAKIEEALADVAQRPGVVFHALIAREAKARVAAFCAAHALPACDLTGDFVSFLEHHAALHASEDHTRLHHIDETYHARIRSMEFTLEHDDGLGLDTLGRADIVLAGISRTSKTPTAIYLAQLGYKVANVSLAMGIDPPEQLLAVNKKRVVALIIRPDKLAEIRTRRNRGWEMGDTAYNDPDMIREEIGWVRRLFAQQGWPILDVTDYAIEETAARVLETMGLGPGTKALR